MKTLSQQYAATIFEQVETFRNSATPAACKEYGSMAHKLPILVRQAGLVQAMTFVYTRGKSGHTALLKDLAQTVHESSPESFLKKCRSNELADYIWLTRKTLAALDWYKRFAESVLNIKADEQGEHDGR